MRKLHVTSFLPAITWLFLSISGHAADPQTLLVADGATGDAFGQTVAMDGGITAIGAPGARALYAYERGGGITNFGMVNKLVPWDEAGAGFAEALGLDGDVLAVGAPTGIGSVYVFLRDSAQPDNWRDMRKLAGEDSANANFGRAVAVSGNRIAVGAPGEDGGGGAIYVFERDEGGPENWGQVARILCPDKPTATGLGQTLALSGHTLAARATMGAQSVVYLFQWGTNGTWTAVRRIEPPADGHEGAGFGQALAATCDQLIIGSPGQTGPGATYVHLRNRDGTNAWGRAKTLTATAPAAGDLFGTSVALSGDKAVVGAPGSPVDDFGTKGKVFAFSRNQGGLGTWGLLKSYSSPDGTPQNGQDFGRAVAAVGALFVAGAPRADGPAQNTQGAAYAFDIPHQLFCHQTSLDDLTVLTMSDAVVVTRGTNEPNDNVYIFERDAGGSGAWGLVQQIEPPADLKDNLDYHFADRACIEDDTLVLGSSDNREFNNPFLFDNHNFPVDVRIFERNGSSRFWKLVKQFLQQNRFSDDILLSGDLLAIDDPEPKPDPNAHPYLAVITNSHVFYIYAGDCAGVYWFPLVGCEDSLVDIVTNQHVEVYSPCEYGREYEFDFFVPGLEPYLLRIDTNVTYEGLIRLDEPNPQMSHRLVLVWTNESGYTEYYYEHDCDEEWRQSEPLVDSAADLLRVETNGTPDGESYVYVYSNYCVDYTVRAPIPGLESYRMTRYSDLVIADYYNELFASNLVLVVTNIPEGLAYYYKDCCDELPSPYPIGGHDDFLLRIETNSAPDGTTNLVYVYSGMCQTILAEPPIPGLEPYRAIYYSTLVAVGFPNELFADHLVATASDGYSGTNYFYANGCDEFPTATPLGGWDDFLIRVEINSAPDGSTNYVYVYSNLCYDFIADAPIPGLEAYGTPCYPDFVVLGFDNPLLTDKLVLVTNNIVSDVDYYYANGCGEYPSPVDTWGAGNLLRIETNIAPDGTTNFVYVYTNACSSWETNRPIPGLEAFIEYDRYYIYDGIREGLMPGEVHVYQRNEGGLNQWGRIATLRASDGVLGDYFGWDLAFDGDTLLAVSDMDSICKEGWGNSAIYVFQRSKVSPGAWHEIKKIPLNGQAVYLSLQGDTAIVSISTDMDNTVLVLERNAGGPDNWGPVQEFTHSLWPSISDQGISFLRFDVQAETNLVVQSVINIRDPKNPGTWQPAQIFFRGEMFPLGFEMVSHQSRSGNLCASLGDQFDPATVSWPVVDLDNLQTTNSFSRIYELGTLPALAILHSNVTLESTSPASIANGTDFGRQKMGSVVEKMFSIRNTESCGDLTISSVTTNGPGAGYFEVIGMPLVIMGDSASNFTVRLHANAEGNANAFLRIESADPASPFILNLQAVISGVHDVTEYLNGGNVDWVFNYVRGTFLGSLTLCLPETYERRLIEPYWYLMESNAYHWLRFPSGRLTNGLYYLDLTRQITNQLPLIGNGDAYLDAGECVVATNIELMGRRDCTGFVWAVWADPPPAPSALDSDGDGLPDAYEKSFFGLNPFNAADAAKDVDRDGMTAWEEWVAGTDPSLAASVLAMDIRVRPDGGVDVSWPTVTGRTYVVESGLDGWTPLPGGVPTGPTTSPSSSFFRVRATLQKKGTTP